MAAATSAEYWSSRTVSRAQHADRQASLELLSWRNHQYMGYSELMPTSGANGLRVLDYGCGPGNDVVGFVEESRPKEVVAMDVSPLALDAARERLALHPGKVEFVEIKEGDKRLPLDDGSIDLVHSSGVIHHTPDPENILREFYRVLSPGGRAQIMIYNYDSIWLHLYANYIFRLAKKLDWSLDKLEVFRRSTDGPECPISRCYKLSDFARLCEDAGFAVVKTGHAISCSELSWLPRRFDALLDKRIGEESRRFLYGLEFDRRGRPLHHGRIAGINNVVHLRKKRRGWF
jgi:ubiquinone/menaquinone biosynthesis C-methylase UbiE